MKSTKLLWISALAIALIGFYTLFSNQLNKTNTQESINPKNIDTYTSQLTSQRQKKDIFFRTGAESPLEDKTSFTGLIYYPASLEYRVTARFEPFADKTQKLTIPLSDGSEEIYERHGHAVFKLQGEVCRLLILKHEGVYSILFRDATSGKQTYGGGRYLDLDDTAFDGNQVTIDFNQSYHPYCVYNHTYACPLPPTENTLPVAVEAGERL